MRANRLFKTAVFAVFITLSIPSAAAEHRPLARVLTFLGDNPWEAIEAIHEPVGENEYRTTKFGGAFHRSNKECDNLLSRHQQRALDVMLENRYITPAFHAMLANPGARQHHMRQYILVTLYREMTQAEARAENISEERFLDKPSLARKDEKIRVHMGSMFAVRGYDLARAGADDLKIPPQKLPYETGQLPKTLTRELIRDNLPAVTEIGRALVEEGGGRQDFSLMMQFLVSALAADARALKLDPAAIPVMGHALDSAHARLFAHNLNGRPLTPALQEEIEKDPATALAKLETTPMPSKEEWSHFSDAVVTGSLATLLKKYPEDAVSGLARQLRQIYPANPLTGAQAMALAQELPTLIRDDFDFMYHDPNRPGQRAPLMIRDWGTGFIKLRIVALMQKYGFPRDEALYKKIEKSIESIGLDGDPDMGHTDWLENKVYLVMPTYQAQQGEGLPAIVVSNLDTTVPVREQEAYLGKVLLAVGHRIEKQLMSFDAWQMRFLLNDMNELRAKKGQAPLEPGQINLASVLDTYDLIFGTSDAEVAIQLKMLGADIRDGFNLNLKHASGGKVDVQIDPVKLGIDMMEFAANPEKYKPLLIAEAQKQMMKFMGEMIQPVTVYRFRVAEIREQEEEHPELARMGAEKLLTPAHHTAKLLRLYITYQ